jgi:pimeloyl-ACP methyl ester carboxylesterase
MIVRCKVNFNRFIETRATTNTSATIKMPHIDLPNAKHSVFYSSAIGKALNPRAALMFMHHATGSTTDWRDQFSYFSQEGYNCISYDRIGFGQSIPNSINDSDDDFHKNIMNQFPLDYYERSIEELADVIDKLNLEKVVLVSHSDGATISLLAASGQHDNMISNYKASDTTLKFLKGKIAAVVAEAPHVWFDEHTLADGFKQFKSTIEQTEKFWSSTARDHQNSPEYAQKVVQRWQELWIKRPDFKRFDARSCLNHIDVPVLVMHGMKDPFFPVEHSKFISDTIGSQSELITFENAGHTPHRETKELYNSAVYAFLKKYQNTVLKFLK